MPVLRVHHGQKENSRLRGQTTRNSSLIVPAPIRHAPPGSTAVNASRHTSCYVTASQHIIEPHFRPRTRQRLLTEEVLSKSVAYNADLSKGNKIYMYQKSRIYSVKNMTQIIRHKYATTLDKEGKRGRHNQKQIVKYPLYKTSPRQTNWGTGTSSFTPKRALTETDRKKEQQGQEVEQIGGTGKQERLEEEQEVDTQGNQSKEKPKGIIEVVLDEQKDTTDDGRTSDASSQHSRHSRDSKGGKMGNKKEKPRSRSSSSSSSRSPFSSSSSSSDKKETHRREVEDQLPIDKCEKHEETQDSRATDDETLRSVEKRATASMTDDDFPSGHQRETSDSLTDDCSHDSRPREGHDRPISRFGRRIPNIHPENSDDDYDTYSSSSKSSFSRSNDREKKGDDSRKGNRETEKEHTNEETNIITQQQQELVDVDSTQTTQMQQISNNQALETDDQHVAQTKVEIEETNQSTYIHVTPITIEQGKVSEESIQKEGQDNNLLPKSENKENCAIKSKQNSEACLRHRKSSESSLSLSIISRSSISKLSAAEESCKTSRNSSSSSTIESVNKERKTPNKKSGSPRFQNLKEQEKTCEEQGSLNHRSVSMDSHISKQSENGDNMSSSYESDVVKIEY